jgi:hypothetical protein
LIERLLALIPRPRKKLLTYHGAFAPAAGYRHRVVPPPPLAHCAFVGLSGRWRDCQDDIHVRHNLEVILKSVHLDVAIFNAERLEETRLFRDALVAKGQEPDSDAPPTMAKL